MLPTPTIALDTLLFDEAPVGLAYLDDELRYVRLNQALATINGMSLESHLGRSVPELWPDLDDRVVTALRSVLATGRPVLNLELAGVTPAAPGVMRSFIHAYRPVTGEAGRVVGINCSVVEITAQKAAEAAARKAHDAVTLLARLNGRLAGATKIEDVGRWVVDTARPAFAACTAGLFLREGDVLRAHAATGYAPDVVAAFGEWSVHDPSPAATVMRSGEMQVWGDRDSLAAEFPVLAQAMAAVTGEAALAVTPLVVDGIALGALHVGFPEPRRFDDDEARNLRAVGDAAAQAIARIHLVEAERRGRHVLAASVEQMPVAMMVSDERGRIIHANEASFRLWEGTAPLSSNAGGWPHRGYHRDGSPYRPEEWPLARSLEHGEVVVDEEVAVEAPTGERRVLSVSSAPIEGDGRRIGGVAVFADVTERRHGEDLREAFLGMLSHELRTPVTTIFGAAHLLARRGDDLALDVRGGLVTDIEEAATHLSRLVENLLVLARAERGAPQIEPVPVLLHHVAARLLVQARASAPGCEFVLDPGLPVPPPVIADEAVVELMLRNLLSNAAKYAPGRIVLALENADGEVHVAVRDEGPGIPAEELATVFELFHRSASTAKMAPGSGIGLFVVRHLADAQGGRAWAANRPTGGLEVGFSLPWARELD